jgi:hypothetical protein
MTKKQRRPVIVCGGQTGRAVIFGWGDEIPEPETICTVYDARMVLYWPQECQGLLGLAADGPKKGLRLTSTVPMVKDTARQIVAVSKEAGKDLRSWTS